MGTEGRAAPRRKAKPATDKGPFEHGPYALRNGKGFQSPNPARLAVWSYTSPGVREFHLDMWDGDVYVGHLTFQMKTE